MHTELEEKGPRLRAQLSQALVEISIPQRLNYTSGEAIKIHGFCDTSENAYVAVIHTSIQKPEGKFIVGLLIFKSLVAPLKVKYISCLELCGAVLLSELMNRTLQAHDHIFDRIIGPIL